MNFIFYFILFVIAIIVHELGHIIVMRKLGVKPNIKFKRGSIEVSHPLAYRFNSREWLMVLIVGVLAGIPFVFFNKIMFLLYVILSSADLIQIMSLWNVKDNRSILQINIDQLEEMKRELKAYEEENEK